MSTETEQLAREADQHRAHVDHTIDRLKDKLSVGQIVDELSGYLREGQGGEMVKNLNKQVRDNPLALGLVGAGIAWLLLGKGAHDEGRPDLQRRYEGYRGPDHSLDRDGRSISDSARGAAAGISDAASSVTSGIGGAARSAGDGISGAGSAVSNAAASASEAVSHAAHDAQDTAYAAGQAVYRSGADAGEQVARYARRARRTFLDTLHDEPLIIGAVALALGAAVGAALPSTRREDQLFGEQRDRLRDEAIDYGSEALEKAEHAVGEAYKAGSEEADRKGLTPKAEGETLAQKVSTVTGKAADAAKDDAKKEGLF